MKISGFTICQNVVTMEYPVVEVNETALPIVDEFIVNIGPSQDETVNLIRSIGSPKIKIVHGKWDESIKKDGLLFSQETNFALSNCTGDWALYLQADEVLHEHDYCHLLKMLQDHVQNDQVLGFVLPFLHFYGDYWSTNPWGFHRDVRIVRNIGLVESCGDAVGFRLKADGGFLQSVHKDRVVLLDVPIFHYGYVKSFRAMKEKERALEPRYHDEQPRPEREAGLVLELYDYKDYDVMKESRGQHPSVMKERIARAQCLKPRVRRWLNWRFYREVVRRGFRG